MPAVSKIWEFSPDYNIVGIDEHLQVLAAFSLYYKDDGEISGFGPLEESITRPLFKLEFDNSSLRGELYFDDALLS